MNGADEKSGVLYLVATPIGNLADISARALSVLDQVDWIAAEDTRHSKKLLAAHSITGKLVSYREQNHAPCCRRLLTQLQAGKDVALISDAGTPALSDPGQRLVQAVVAEGIQVIPVPGACAALAALIASGLPTDQFLFLGFLPRKAGAFARLAEELRPQPATLIFYESPRRLGKTLARLAESFGPRDAVVVRELTKMYESFDRAPLPELAERYSQGAKGEVTLIVAGAEQASPTLAVAAEWQVLVTALRAGRKLGSAEIAKMLAPLSGLSKKVVYALAASLPDADSS